MTPHLQASSQPPLRRKLAYVILAFLYPMIHFIVQLTVQVFAVLAFQTRAAAELGVGAATDELAAYAQERLLANANLINAISNLVAIPIVILAALLICRATKETELSVKELFSLKPIRTHKLILAAVMAILFYHVVILFINVVGSLFPSLLESYLNASSNLDSQESVWIRFLALVILAPLTEELVYRALSLSHLKKALPSFAAVLIASLVFGLAHGNFLWFLYAAALGVVFGFLFTRTESVYTSLAAHAAFNLMGFVYSCFDVESMSEAQIRVYNYTVSGIACLSLVLVPILLYFLLRKPKKAKQGC